MKRLDNTLRSASKPDEQRLYRCKRITCIQKAEGGRVRGREEGNENWWDSYRDKEESSLRTLMTESGYADLHHPSAIAPNLRLGFRYDSKTALDGRPARDGGRKEEKGICNNFN